MKPFWRSLLPGSRPEQTAGWDEVAVLKERILQTFAVISLVIGIAVLALVMPTYLRLQQWLLIFAYVSCLFGMILVTFGRHLAYSIRVGIVLAVMYAIGLGSLIVYGLSGNGPVMMVGFVALAAIFLGNKGAVTGTMVAIATMTTVGLLMVSQKILLPSIEIQANAGLLADWINRILVISLLGVTLIIAMSTLTMGLRQALFEQKRVSQELSQGHEVIQQQLSEQSIAFKAQWTQLETAQKLTREISQITDLADVLNRSVEMIRSEYHFDFAAIYLIDAHGDHAALRSAAGVGSDAMVAQAPRIILNESHPVALTIRNQATRLMQDVAMEPFYLRNPLLPETRAELIIPLFASNKVIGVLDVQNNLRRSMNTNDVNSVQVVCEYLAAAIDKALLIQNLTIDVEEMRENYRLSVQTAWDEFHRKSRRSFSYRIHQGVIDTGALSYPQTGLSSSNEKQVEQTAAISQKELPGSTISVPIRLRDTQLGTLDLRFNTEKVPGHLLKLLEDVSDRLALALENARLVEENQINHARDQLVHEISTQVQAEANIDKVLRIVATELGRSMGVSDVVVQLREFDHPS